MSDIIMQIQDIVKEFPLADGSTLRACNGISIDVERGETLAIVGESGCGKSTLVKTIMNMHEPTSGSVIFRGKLSSYSNGLSRSYSGIQSEDESTRYYLRTITQLWIN